MASICNLLLCTVLALLIFEASGYVFLRAEKDTNGCRDENGQLKKEKDTWNIKGKCESAECIIMDKNYFQRISGCGKISIGEGCKEVTNAAAPYPDCCPRGQCN